MIFVDTGAFIAKYFKNDEYHSVSNIIWKKVIDKYPKVYTSNFIIDETLTLLGRKTDSVFAYNKTLNIYNSNFIEILRPEKEQEIKSMEIFKKYRDHKISFTDCISYIFMKDKRLTEIFSFDNHFTIMGLSVITE